MDKFFDMAYVLREKQVKLWRTNSKEEQPHGGIICKSYEGVKESNPDDMEAHEATLTM